FFERAFRAVSWIPSYLGGESSESYVSTRARLWWCIACAARVRLWCSRRRGAVASSSGPSQWFPMAVATSSPPRRTDDAVQTFDDCVVLLCYNHDMRCGLVEGASKGLWLPYKDIAQGESWESAVESLLKELSLKAYTNQGMIQMLRIQPGLNQAFFTRVIFMIRVPEVPDQGADEMGEQVRLQWIAVEEIQRMAKLRPYPFMGVEPTELCKQLLHNKTLPPNCDFVEINATTALTSQTVSAKSQIEQMLESAKFGQPEQDMSYLSSLGWDVTPYLGDLFRAMDVHNRGALTWKELVLGLAAMEPGTQHGGTPGELRCRHIFRLYDGN
ncbi:unnamed protein product, partial [Ixodes pacificus]